MQPFVTEDDVRRLERSIKQLRDDVTNELAQLRDEVKKASNFQVGFQAISKGLTFVCIIVAALATAYGALR